MTKKINAVAVQKSNIDAFDIYKWKSNGKMVVDVDSIINRNRNGYK